MRSFVRSHSDPDRSRNRNWSCSRRLPCRPNSYTVPVARHILNKREPVLSIARAVVEYHIVFGSICGEHRLEGVCLAVGVTHAVVVLIKHVEKCDKIRAAVALKVLLVKYAWFI